MEAKQSGTGPLNISRCDTYDWYLALPHPRRPGAGHRRARSGPTWRGFVAHPSYDSVWQERAVQRYLRHTTVPTLTVGGWWDQEDVFGSAGVVHRARGERQRGPQLRS